MAEEKQYYYDDYDMKSITALHTVSSGFDMPVRHLHSQYEFLYVRKGSVCVESNADSLQVEFPCLIIHKPFSLHRANASKDQVYDRYVVMCTKEQLDKISGLVPRLPAIDSKSLTVIKVTREIDFLLIEYFTKIQAYCASGMDNLALIFLSLLLATITEYTDCDKLIPTKSEGYISEVVNYIGQKYSEKLSIDAIADKFFVSRSKLIADFKKHISVSIKQYIMLIRVFNAQRYLQGGKSISETALLCGFYDESHFVGTFHSLTGITPKKFIKSLKSTGEK